MSNNIGFGVMIGMLGGNSETVETIKAALNKVIKEAKLNEDANSLDMTFDDGTGIRIFDDGQSCCEHRYMRTDDDLDYYTGSTFNDIAIKDAPGISGEYGDEHEVQFLEITTSKGVFQMANHNEHNGYYGGFWIAAKSLTHP